MWEADRQLLGVNLGKADLEEGMPADAAAANIADIRGPMLRSDSGNRTYIITRRMTSGEELK